VAFTSITVTGTYVETGTGTPSAGSVRFLLSAPMRDVEDDITVAPSEVVATLDGSGSFSVVLYATNDTWTEPKGVTYEVTERITGAARNKYFIAIDKDSPAGTVDLSDLVPDIAPVTQFNYATVEYVNDHIALADEASEISFVATSEISSTNVQDAIEEVRERSRYVHNQASASNTWNITHNMRFYPNVTIVDTGLTAVVGEVTYQSENALLVTFSQSFAGKAYLS
jgi:hypothetical protein